MNTLGASTCTTDIVGGVYRERCMRPAWREIYGSGGRAASALAAMGAKVTLHSYLDEQTEQVLRARAAFENFGISSVAITEAVAFEYDHGLATPRIYGQRSFEPALEIKANQIVRFGLIEGDAIVHGQRVVYDPQNASAPAAFHANGSTAGELALVLNRHEAGLMLGTTNASTKTMAEALINQGYATVVVIKQGPLGAIVSNGKSTEMVPAYRSSSVWKIGSGDNFVAHFAFRWMHEGRSPTDSAELASRATAYYCQTGGFATNATLETFFPEPISPSSAFQRGHKPSVYLAGPFFTMAQLWLVEQTRGELQSMGLKVISPYHDVGCGSAEDVVKLDLAGIDQADMVFAIGDGMDSGTVYEIGYACAKGKPVVMYCENESSEDKKMMEGSGCLLCNDYVSAIYCTLWTACCL